MKPFHCLLVENDRDQASAVREELASDERIILTIAGSAQDAYAHIRETFFHVAIVDLHLASRTERNNTDGQKVLRHLMTSRPSCRRFLFTKYLDMFNDVIAGLFTPSTPVLHGIVNKEDFHENVATCVKAEAEAWWSRTVDIQGMDTLYNTLRDRRIKTEFAQLTAEELQFVLSGLFPRSAVQTSDHAKDDGADVQQIKICSLPGGRSRSVVVAAELTDSTGAKGISCVIKVGPRLEIVEEAGRFNRYVKFRLAANRRVELLGLSTGDVTSAVCYSFAGETADNITTLSDLMKTESSRVKTYISTLFAPNRKEWYSHVTKREDLAGFFFDVYNVDAPAVRKEIKMFSESLPAKTCRIRDDMLIMKGFSTRLPTTVLGAGKFRKEFLSCVTHGDLNSRNIIVPKHSGPKSGDNFVLIDYRYTGPGPVAVDFASLEASVRESSTPKRLTDVVRQFHLESRIWKTVWSGANVENLPYWAELSILIGQSARKNFEALGADEYAATCFLLALRLFRIQRLPAPQRLRLLLWMCFLSSVIESD